MIDASKIVCSATEPQKHLSTKDGRFVYIYWVAPDGFHGAIKNGERDRSLTSWNVFGESSPHLNSGTHLTQKEPETVFYTNDYAISRGLYRSSLEECEKNRNPDCLGVIKKTTKNGEVTLEYIKI